MCPPREKWRWTRGRSVIRVKEIRTLWMICDDDMSSQFIPLVLQYPLCKGLFSISCLCRCLPLITHDSVFLVTVDKSIQKAATEYKSLTNRCCWLALPATFHSCPKKYNLWRRNCISFANNDMRWDWCSVLRGAPKIPGRIAQIVPWISASD